MKRDRNGKADWVLNISYTDMRCVVSILAFAVVLSPWNYKKNGRRWSLKAIVRKPQGQRSRYESLTDANYDSKRPDDEEEKNIVTIVVMMSRRRNSIQGNKERNER